MWKKSASCRHTDAIDYSHIWYVDWKSPDSSYCMIPFIEFQGQVKLILRKFRNQNCSHSCVRGGKQVDRREGLFWDARKGLYLSLQIILGKNSSCAWRLAIYVLHVCYTLRKIKCHPWSPCSPGTYLPSPTSGAPPNQLPHHPDQYPDHPFLWPLGTPWQMSHFWHHTRCLTWWILSPDRLQKFF